MFLGIILRVLRLEVSVYNVYITNYIVLNHFRPTVGGYLNPLVEVTVNSKEENSKTFVVPITSKNSASGGKCL